MRVACWISKATRTHANAHAHTHGYRPHTQICYIHVYIFYTQQCFRERASMLRCTYIACLVKHLLQATVPQNVKQMDLSTAFLFQRHAVDV